MSFRFSSESRQRACERMLAGDAVKDLAAELNVSDATLYRWRREALIDAGKNPGLLNNLGYSETIACCVVGPQPLDLLRHQAAPPAGLSRDPPPEVCLQRAGLKVPRAIRRVRGFDADELGSDGGQPRQGSQRVRCLS